MTIRDTRSSRGRTGPDRRKLAILLIGALGTYVASLSPALASLRRTEAYRQGLLTLEERATQLAEKNAVLRARILHEDADLRRTDAKAAQLAARLAQAKAQVARLADELARRSRLEATLNTPSHVSSLPAHSTPQGSHTVAPPPPQTTPGSAQPAAPTLPAAPRPPLETAPTAPPVSAPPFPPVQAITGASGGPWP